MAPTFNLTLDALSLQGRVEEKGLQPWRGSSRAACGQDAPARLQPLAWQCSRGEPHLGCLGGEATWRLPIPLPSCEVWWTQQSRAAQPGRHCAAPRQPGSLVAQLGSPSPRRPHSRHPPAPQPAPLPESRQPFLCVTFQGPQVVVLSSKAQHSP